MQLSWRKLDAFKCKKARVIKSLFCKCLGERWKDICKRFYKCPKDQSAPSFHLFTFWVKKSMNSKFFFFRFSLSNHLTFFFSSKWDLVDHFPNGFKKLSLKLEKSATTQITKSLDLFRYISQKYFDSIMWCSTVWSQK